MNYIRLWDEQAALRVDKFIANSKFVAQRIRKYYHQDSRVIYPPVKTDLLYSSKNIKDYFLMTGRFLPYKRFDLAIEAFNYLGWPLYLVGDGPERKKLQKKARSNIKFVGLVSDQKLKEYFAHCQAFIFPQEEDFGITALEAMASGRPVIAFKAGGALETIKENITGLYFTDQTAQSLIEALLKYKEISWDGQRIRNHALNFDEKLFKERVHRFIDQTLKK
jgi:glycosyltransferase involved in cell wall biosynthesis